MKFLTNLMVLGLYRSDSSVRASKTKDESYSDSLKDCLEFAEQFENTCESTSKPLDFDAVHYKDISYSRPVGVCAGTTTGSGRTATCTWKRKLCVTCFKDGN